MSSAAQTRTRKRLLFVVEAMGGGVFTYIVNLTNRLVEDYDLYLAYAVRPQTPEDYRDYFDPRIHLIEVKDFIRPIRLQHDFRALLDLVRIGREVRPDIIHLHSSKAGILGRIAYWNARVPLFYTPHGYSFLMRHASALKRTFYRLMELVMAKTRCTTIACSKGELDETLPMTRRAFLVNNGIDPEEIDSYLRQASGKKNPEPRARGAYTVFTIGRICDQKNPELFNQVALALPDLRFLWIGDGELRDALTAPNIEVTGWLSRKEVLSLANQADCFLLPSLWEGLPISLLESMYLGKPCVVSDVIGSRDVIRDGENGFVCGTTEEFVRAICEASRTEVAESLREAALRDIRSEYNVAVMAQSYETIYERALQGASERGGGELPAARAARELL